MKKTGLILIVGLLLIGLSHGSNSKATLQATCTEASHVDDGVCLASEALRQPNLPVQAALPENTMPEQVEEQRVAITNRLLQLIDAFGKLVMVI
ncbi:hypothetical protein O71_09419 [Pontibacter sp. BAB1700]|nr:hypothetical protein O71_09419 [Pontibacter sp. BAB1700]